MLRVAGAHKAFGRHQVLLGVDLQVPAGTIAAVLGPSGCGKTTLLRLIAGFEELDQGSISIAGIEVATGGRRSVPAERRRVGVVPQEGALFPHLDLAGNVGFGLARGRNDAARIEEMLEM
ncbi:MAG: ATP-binding cassette domain-containing protein, partial [Actinomycetota bacterium]|nr:ATP-binding cassette domain-containing protein [Actinomycetota bacterium]